MSGIVSRLQELLDKGDIEYEIIHHKTDYRAKATARDTNTPQVEFAKSVLLLIDDQHAMAVVPSSMDVALGKVRDATGAQDVRLAHEEDFEKLCPDCEVGAAPPFGNLYDLPVYVSRTLAADEKITFNAGSHRDAIRMRYRDFEALVKPQVLGLCKHE
jgi:Ala-tRNA(Pro) deacylase